MIHKEREIDDKDRGKKKKQNPPEKGEGGFTYVQIKYPRGGFLYCNREVHKRKPESEGIICNHTNYKMYDLLRNWKC